MISIMPFSLYFSFFSPHFVIRAYRIGQQRSVVVYRLITCGTIEEKIYRKQVFKDSVNQQVTGDSSQPLRYMLVLVLHS